MRYSAATSSQRWRRVAVTGLEINPVGQMELLSSTTWTCYSSALQIIDYAVEQLLTCPCFRHDFDNDGFDDLAIGVPEEDVGVVGDAGTVTVLYGSASGVTATESQSWGQNTAGVKGAAEADDFFGDVLIIGDFDNDGFDDLAIGAPGEDIGAAANAGAASVLFGSADGLSAAEDELWHQNSGGVLGSNGVDDLFGGAFA
jgi:hypothetical protein